MSNYLDLGHYMLGQDALNEDRLRVAHEAKMKAINRKEPTKKERENDPQRIAARLRDCRVKKIRRIM